MESLLGFKETTSTLDEKSYGCKLVPWLNWDEWDSVRVSLFSSSTDSIASALRRISAWSNRGCLPVVIEVTASVIEIQQKDPYFREDLSNGASESEEMLAMLYSMAIMRLVNCVIEKTRKKTEVSIAEAAEAMSIPRMLIDIRHEGSHRDLPSLRLLRLASRKALNWLKAYYWDPQMEAIPFQRAKAANIRKEIRSRLRELAACLKVKRSGLSSSHVKGKRSKHSEQLCGRSKLFSLMARKVQPSKQMGSKKQISRILTNLVRLYSFFSSEVVSVLLGLFLRTSSPLDMIEFPEISLLSLSLDAVQTAVDEWKPVIIKFSTKEPELILNLLHGVLDLIDSREAIVIDAGGENLSLSRYDAEVQKIGVLSSLFSWLVEILKELKPLHSEGSEDEMGVSSALPKATLVELLRRCLLVSKPGNNQLLRSALLLAQMMGGSSLIEKLNKLSILFSSFSDSDNSLDVTPEKFMDQDNNIEQAVQKLRSIKQQRLKNESALETRGGNLDTKSRWTIAESWNPCPIGMLPRTLGSSGHLPILDYIDEQTKASGSIERQENTQDSSSRGENLELRKCGGKQEAICDPDVLPLKNSGLKRLRGETIEVCEVGDMDIVSSPREPEGRLLMGGVWRKVGEKEVQEIQSAIRILI